jgi:hypothetical protein
MKGFLCANILVLAIYLYYVLTRIGQYLLIIAGSDIEVGENPLRCTI